MDKRAFLPLVYGDGSQQVVTGEPSDTLEPADPADETPMTVAEMEQLLSEAAGEPVVWKDGVETVHGRSATTASNNCVAPVQNKLISTANCLQLVEEDNGYRFQHYAHTQWLSRGSVPRYLLVWCITNDNRGNVLENRARYIYNKPIVAFNQLGVTPGSDGWGTGLPTGIIPADGRIYTRTCQHWTQLPNGTWAPLEPTTVSVQVAQSQYFYAEAYWTFMFTVKNGAVYALTVNVFDRHKQLVKQVIEQWPATCEPVNGKVGYGADSITFSNGGYLVCTPAMTHVSIINGQPVAWPGNFRTFVREQLIRLGYSDTNVDIFLNSYTDPWAAADIKLSEQSVTGGYGVIAAHPDVSLKITPTSTGAYQLTLPVVAPCSANNCGGQNDALAGTTWALQNGDNQFWVGQNPGNFRRQWLSVWNNFSMYFDFLPVGQFPVQQYRYFWHNGTNTNSDPVGAFGKPSETDNLRVTVGCDANGNNCVNMTLRTLLIDPTIYGG